MLSPGKYHARVPKDPLENLRFRVEVLTAAEQDARVRRGLLEMCRLDILFYINTFVWQYNPLKPGEEYGPFITWKSQDEALTGREPGKEGLLWCMEHGRSAVMQKSREMGGTYLCMLAGDWVCRFHKNRKVLVISRNAEAVDRPGEPDCIFWKLDQVIEYLPTWMKGDMTRRTMRFGYGNGSALTGTASTAKAGVGGRAHLIFVDEFSQIEADREVRQRTASTTNCRVFNGTHLGLTTEFFKVCQEPEFRQITLHWTQHPDKVAGLYAFDPERPGRPLILDGTYDYPPDYQFVLDGTPTGGPRPGVRSPWYDAKCKEIGDSRAIAMDLDINPTGSVSSVFDAIMIQKLVSRCASPPVWEGVLEYDEDTGEPERLVQVNNGPIKLWVHPRADGRAPAGKFAFGGDISNGVGATPSVFAGADVTSGLKVFEFARADIYPEKLAPLMVAVCRHFRDALDTPALLGWEMAGPGHVFAIEVFKLGFRHFYYNTDKAKVRNKATDKPGWYPGRAAKVLLIKQYMAALEAGTYENRSKDALLECLKMMWAGHDHIVHPHEIADDDPSGAGVNHADRVMADAITCMLVGPKGRKVVEQKVEEVVYGSFLWRRLQRRQRELEEAGA